LKQRLQDSTKLVLFFKNWREFGNNRHYNFKFRQISDFAGFLSPKVRGEFFKKKPSGLLSYNFGFHCVTSEKYKGGLKICMNFPGLF
jgi:hypothetical protein